MPYQIEHIAASLKAARKAKGLNQTELGNKTGLPQSHISKIESGRTDLKLSSLIELSRILDLEFVLVPRKLLPAVQSIIRNTAAHDAAPQYGALSLKGHAPATRLSAYTLDDDDG